MCSAEYFWELGSKLMNHNTKNNLNTGMRRFKSFFGVSPIVCAKAWFLLHNDRPQGAKPEHLLWTLIFLKQYNTEHINHSITKADEKTFRKWIWIFIELLAGMGVISWESRLKICECFPNVFISLDGVDFKINEPTPFNTKWYSHKFKGSGLRYEIGICIATGIIVWVHGGFPCGEYPDLKIAKDLVVSFLNDGEQILADKGYKDQQYFLNPSRSLHKQLLARHETLNGRMKNFKILSETFRHSLHKHPRCVHAIANLTQLSLQHGEPLFDM